MRQPHYVRGWRVARGLTQEQLADRIGISQGNLSKVDKGKRKYGQAFLEAAAPELRCDVADLLIRNPGAPKASGRFGARFRNRARPRPRCPHHLHSEDRHAWLG